MQTANLCMKKFIKKKKAGKFFACKYMTILLIYEHSRLIL